MTRAELAAQGLKACTACGEVKPFGEFDKSAKSSDGVRARCRDCRRAERVANADKTKAYYTANRETILAQQREYASTNRDEIAEKKAAYRAANPDKIVEIRKAHYDANREAVQAAVKEYKAANREKIAVQAREYREANRLNESLRTGANRARKRGLPAEKLTQEQVRDHWTNHLRIDPGKCAYCGADYEQLDHAIPLTRAGSPGHVLTNLLPACQPCNHRKHSLTAYEFRHDLNFDKTAAHIGELVAQAAYWRAEAERLADEKVGA